MPFSATWSALQANLTAGIVVSNWTAAKQLLGDRFTITSVSSSHVQVDTPGALNIQRISSKDFEKVYDCWQKYCARHVPRREIRDSTHFSKYVISIFHWLEGQCGGRLP
jgi:hypothetical protein